LPQTFYIVSPKKIENWKLYIKSFLTINNFLTTYEKWHWLDLFNKKFYSKYWFYPEYLWIAVIWKNVTNPKKFNKAFIEYIAKWNNFEKIIKWEITSFIYSWINYQIIRFQKNQDVLNDRKIYNWYYKKIHNVTWCNNLKYKDTYSSIFLYSWTKECWNAYEYYYESTLSWLKY